SRLKTGDYIREVAVDPRDPEVLYLTSSPATNSGGAAACSDGILRSGDGGHTWTSLADGLAWPFGGPIVLDPGAPDRLFLGSPGTGFQPRSHAPGGATTPAHPPTRAH